jgi:hypothetical protein
VTQPQCVNCGSALTPEDIFCGSCGAAAGSPAPASVRVNTMGPGTARLGASAQAPPASGGARGGAGDTGWWQPRPELVEVIPPDQFFDHATAQQGGRLSNSTR